MANGQIKTAVFGGGCFWCTEAVFNELKGVVSVVPGYSGGDLKNPGYEQVTKGYTGHIEVIKFEFDESQITYKDLLAVFFATHDPTTKNRQGADIGPQYQSVIFYADEEQKQQALRYVKDLEEQNLFGKPIVTEVRPLKNFFIAEDYHQKYYENHKNLPYCQLVIDPKLEKLKKQFISLLKT